MNSFDKVIGYGAIKAELIRICDVVKYPEKYFRLGVYIPRGILLHGNPGLGKTLLANCFIEESGRKCFTVRKDKPNGDFVNGIRQVFDKAKIQSENGTMHSQSFIEANICWLLGGKAATETVLSRVDVGCVDDIRRAYSMVCRFVDDFCAYGFEAFTKREFYMPPSEALVSRKELLVAQEMERYYRRAKRILVENRSFLDKLVAELLERKTLSQKDIKEIRARL